jgi:hypothetical protein
MWAIRHNLHFCAEIIEVALDESTQKDTFWVVPITETRELAHHQTFLSQRPDLFPTREAAVTEWVARLKKTTQSVVKELAKWSSTSDPTDAEILAWLLQKIRLFEWTFGTEVHYSLKATAERRFDDVEDIRGVVAQCINEKKGRFKQAPEGATML